MALLVGCSVLAVVPSAAGAQSVSSRPEAIKPVLSEIPSQASSVTGVWSETFDVSPSSAKVTVSLSGSHPIDVKWTDCSGSRRTVKFTGTGNRTSWSTTVTFTAKVGSSTATKKMQLSLSKGIGVTGSAVEPAQDACKPGSPTSLKASPASNGTSAEVSWSKPSSSGGSAISGYSVQYRPASGSWKWVSQSDINWTAPSSKGSASLKSLTAGKSYEFRVRAKNSYGSGPWASKSFSTPAKVAPVLTGVSGALTSKRNAKSETFLVSPADAEVTVTIPSSSNITVSVGDPVVTASSRNHLASFTTKGCSGNWSGTATYVATHDGLTDKKTQEVTLGATGSKCKPGKPTSLKTRPNGDGTGATVSWNAPSFGGDGGVSGYRLEYRRDSQSTWTARNRSGTSATLSSLRIGTKYRVRVRANNSHGSSGWLTGSFTTANPRPDINVSTTPLTTKSSSVQRTLSVTPVGSDMSVSMSSGSSISASISPTVQALPAAGRAWNTTFTTADCSGTWSGTVTYTATYGTRTDTASHSVTLGVSGSKCVPGRPGLLTAVSDTSGTSATVSWPAPSFGGDGGVTGYRVENRKDGTSTWTGTDVATTSTTLTGLEPGAKYRLRVRAKNAHGSSSWRYGQFTASNQTPVISGVSSPLSGTAKSVTQAFTVSPVPDSVTVELAAAQGLSVGEVTAGSRAGAYSVTFSGTDCRSVWTATATYTATRTVAGESYSGTAQQQVRLSYPQPATPLPLAAALTCPPGRPTNLDVELESDGTGANVSWRAPSFVGDSVVSGYHVEHRRATGTWSRQTVTGVTTALSGLVPDAGYEVRVRAYSTAGNGAWTKASFTATPTVPVLGGIKDEESHTARSFTEHFTVTPAGSVTTVTSDSDAIIAAHTSTGTVERQAVLSLHRCAVHAAADITYKAVNTVGTKEYPASVTQELTLGAKPKSPQVSCVRPDVNAAGMSTGEDFWVSHSDTTVKVSAKPDAGYGTLQIVSKDADGYSRYVTLSIDDCAGAWDGTVTYAPTGGTAFAQRLRIGHGGNHRAETKSVDAADDNAKAADGQCVAPGAPSGLTATARGNSSIALSWKKPASDGGGRVIGYTVEYTPKGGTAATVDVDLPAAPANVRYELTGLQPATGYSIRVRARNAAGSGPWTAPVTEATHGGISLHVSPLEIDSPADFKRVDYTVYPPEARVTVAVERSPVVNPRIVWGTTKGRERDLTIKLEWCAHPWEGTVTYTAEHDGDRAVVHQEVRFGKLEDDASTSDATAAALTPCGARRDLVEVDRYVTRANASTYTETFYAPYVASADDGLPRLTVMPTKGSGLEVANVTKVTNGTTVGYGLVQWQAVLRRESEHDYGAGEVTYKLDYNRLGEPEVIEQWLSLGRPVNATVGSPRSKTDGSVEFDVGLEYAQSELIVAARDEHKLDITVTGNGTRDRIVRVALSEFYPHWEGDIEFVAHHQLHSSKPVTHEIELGEDPGKSCDEAHASVAGKDSVFDSKLLPRCVNEIGNDEYTQRIHIKDGHQWSVRLTAPPNENGDMLVISRPMYVRSVVGRSGWSLYHITIKPKDSYWSGTVTYQAGFGPNPKTFEQHVTIGTPLSLPIGPGNNKIAARNIQPDPDELLIDKFQVSPQVDGVKIKAEMRRLGRLHYKYEGKWEVIPHSPLKITEVTGASGEGVSTAGPLGKGKFTAGHVQYIASKPGWGTARAETEFIIGAVPKYIVADCLFGQTFSPSATEMPLCHKYRLFTTYDELWTEYKRRWEDAKRICNIYDESMPVRWLSDEDFVVRVRDTDGRVQNFGGPDIRDKPKDQPEARIKVRVQALGAAAAEHVKLIHMTDCLLHLGDVLAVNYAHGHPLSDIFTDERVDKGRYWLQEWTPHDPSIPVEYKFYNIYDQARHEVRSEFLYEEPESSDDSN